jgi:hypothetical protein
MAAPRPTTIDIPELRRIVNELLLHVERVAGQSVAIDSDFYWDLPSPEVWDVSKGIPKVDEVGSLGDDLEFLRSMSEIVEDGPSLNLIHAAPLLKYLGEKVGA